MNRNVLFLAVVALFATGCADIMAGSMRTIEFEAWQKPDGTQVVRPVPSKAPESDGETAANPPVDGLELVGRWKCRPGPLDAGMTKCKDAIVELLAVPPIAAECKKPENLNTPACQQLLENLRSSDHPDSQKWVAEVYRSFGGYGAGTVRAERAARRARGGW